MQIQPIGAKKYTAQFILAAQIALRHEGGYVDRSEDAGGPTKYGISLRFLRAENIDINGDGIIDKQDVLDITEEKAVELYYTYIWSKNHYDKIDIPHLVIKIFDQSLPLGAHEANMILQRAVNNVIEQLNCVKMSCANFSTQDPQFKNEPLIVDGVLGVKSITMINRLILENDAIEEEFVREAQKVYRQIVEKNPTNAVNLEGWLIRLKDV